jgi:hypothetical protein
VQSQAEPESSPGVSPWGIAFTIIAACASLLPAVFFDASRRIQETERWWLCGIPIVSFMVLGAWYAFIRGSISTDGGKGSGGWILKAIGLPAIYTLCHWALAVRIGPAIEPQHLPQLATLVSTGTAYILMSCFFLTWAEHRKAVANDLMIVPRSNLAAAMPAFAVALFAAAVAWNAIKADVGSMGAMWSSSGQREVSDKVLSDAIKAMPHERQYQRQRTFAFLGFAMEDIQRFGASAETFPQIKHSLDIAEKQARASMLQFPKDPWILLALANALQIRALPILRPLTAEEGSHAALEADEMFARAYELFPNQPLLLRNWAQLRFHGGDHWGAYRLLDRMEIVVPNEIAPYYERIVLAKLIGDSSAIREALERAKMKLERSNMERLAVVANLQQP